MPRHKSGPAVASGQPRAVDEPPRLALTAVSAENFKSFRRISLALSGLQVLIGANASGKSNAVQVLRFLRDIALYGPANAISLQGGEDFLRNVLLAEDEPSAIEAQLRYAVPRPHSIDRFAHMDVEEVTYRVTVPTAGARGEGAGVERALILRGTCEYTDTRRPAASVGSGTGEARYVSRHGDGNNGWELLDGGVLQDVDPASWETPAPIDGDVRAALQGIGVYDISPRLSKGARPFSGKADLEEDGSNLALVLKRILDAPDARRRFLNLITDVLPYVADLNVERLADRSVLFSLRETFSGSLYLPASFLSDGTIQICALIAALYFEGKSPVVIEEPERNIHPHLIARVVGMMKDAATQKQILVTTHNPEFVKHVGLPHLRLVARDPQGFSNISRPADSEQVKTFLKNELGLDDLYVQGLLDG